MKRRIADWLYRKLFSDGRAYHGPGWYALADMLKRHKREGHGGQAIKNHDERAQNDRRQEDYA